MPWQWHALQSPRARILGYLPRPAG
jgi:hypothetical protein